jgi:hypothetical protein
LRVVRLRARRTADAVFFCLAPSALLAILYTQLSAQLFFQLED